MSNDDLEGYEEYFLFTNYYFDLETALEKNLKIKELLNHDSSLILAFSNAIFNDEHIMTIMQNRPTIDTVVFVLIENLKNELNKLKINARTSLIGSLFLRKTYTESKGQISNYIYPAIVVDSIRMGFKIGPEEVERACEQSLL